MGIAFRVYLMVLVVGSSASSAFAGFSFQEIGALGSDAYSVPSAVSGDGKVVVGYSRASTYNGNNAAWKWSSSTPLTPIAGLTVPYDVSYDGSVIVGTNGSTGWRLPPTGATQIPRTPGTVSPDGNIVIGAISSSDQGFRWTSSGITYIPPITNTYSPANGMNSDGSIIVGQARSAAGNYIAYRWTAATGTVALTTGIGAASNSGALAVSEDGSLIVGFTLQQGSGVAAYWTAASGWQPMVSNGDFGSAQDLTPDGRFAVGTSNGRAFIWDAQHGLRRLQDLLAADGINLTGWNLSSATGISADGQTIVGYATTPSGATTAWIASLPEPGSLCALGVGCVALYRRSRQTT